MSMVDECPFCGSPERAEDALLDELVLCRRCGAQLGTTDAESNMYWKPILASRFQKELREMMMSMMRCVSVPLPPDDLRLITDVAVDIIKATRKRVGEEIDKTNEEEKRKCQEKSWKDPLSKDSPARYS